MALFRRECNYFVGRGRLGGIVRRLRLVMFMMPTTGTCSTKLGMIACTPQMKWNSASRPALPFGHPFLSRSWSSVRCLRSIACSSSNVMFFIMSIVWLISRSSATTHSEIVPQCCPSQHPASRPIRNGCSDASAYCPMRTHPSSAGAAPA